MYTRGGGGGGDSGGGAIAERNNMSGHGYGRSDTAPISTDGYEYEAKRQRLLHGGSAMYSSYYQSQSQNQSPYISTASSSSALQSSIVASLSSYFASSPSPQHGGGGVGSSTGMFSSYEARSGTGSRSPNPNYYRNGGLNTGIGPSSNHLSSSSFGSGLNSGLNRNYLSNSTRNNRSHHHDSSSAASPAPFMPYTGPSSSSLSPFRGRSPPTNVNFIHSHRRHHHPHPEDHHYHYPGASPPGGHHPLMSIDRRSPHMMSSPFYCGPTIPPSRGFPVVRLRGLPFNCTENDVYEFFRGLDVVDVLLTHKHGRFSGEAYCVFAVPIQVEFALRRNKQNMGQRYIEVFRSRKHDYYLAVTAEVSEHDKPVDVPAYLPPSKTSDKDEMEHTGVLKLRGLPFSASKKDVIDFFLGFNLKDHNIHFVVHSDGRATGEAYVEFDGPGQSKQAMLRDKMMLGSRYVELFPSSRDEITKAMGRHRK